MDNMQKYWVSKIFMSKIFYPKFLVQMDNVEKFSTKCFIFVRLILIQYYMYQNILHQ